MLGVHLLHFLLKFSDLCLNGVAICDISVHFVNKFDMIEQTGDREFVVVEFDPHFLVLILHFL